jgi:hypothetical protein
VNRVYLENGKWFDEGRTTLWEKATRRDDSLATGLQWDYEKLYRTAKGAWVIYWLEYHGYVERYRLIDPKRAAEWLIHSGHDLPAELAEFGDKMAV